MMTAQDTENQAGGAEPQNNEGDEIGTNGGEQKLFTDAEFDALAKQALADGVVIAGNDTVAGADAAAETESTDTTGTPAADAGSPASSNDTASGKPAADAPPTPSEKLHAAAVAYIIAARVVGVDRVEYLEAKAKEIAD